MVCTLFVACSVSSALVDVSSSDQNVLRVDLKKAYVNHTNIQLHYEENANDLIIEEDNYL